MQKEDDDEEELRDSITGRKLRRGGSVLRKRKVTEWELDEYFGGWDDSD